MKTLPDSWWLGVSARKSNRYVQLVTFSSYQSEFGPLQSPCRLLHVAGIPPLELTASDGVVPPGEDMLI
jgi:hypothetical protein